MDIFLLLLGVALTFGTAVFVAAEFSLVALDPASVAKRQKSGEKGLGPVLRALSTLSTQLSGAQVGITLTTILLGYTTQGALAKLLTNLLGNTGLAVALSVALAAAIAAVIVNGFSMLFGELVPKNMALADPLLTARLTAPLQLAFTWVFGPLIKVLNGTANALLRAVGIEPVEEISSARSASELAALVHHSAQMGTMEPATASLFTASIAMGQQLARDVMTDRGRVAHLPADATVTDLMDLAKETGYSRFPVMDEDGENFTRVALLRQGVAVPRGRRSLVPVSARPVSVEAPEVPETLGMNGLLKVLRDGPQMAFVVDEFGSTSGVVTLEDVVEELVGEVSDEHDRRRLGIRPSPKGGFIVPGTVRPDELATRTGLAVEEDGPYETLAGLVMTKLDRIPTVGDTVSSLGTGLEVISMKGRRVTRLLVQPQEVMGTEDPAGTGPLDGLASSEGGSK